MINGAGKSREGKVNEARDLLAPVLVIVHGAWVGGTGWREVIALLAPFEVTPAQRDAWMSQIAQVQELARQIRRAHFFLEFSIPRMGRRIDVTAVMPDAVAETFVAEYDESLT